MKLFVSFVVFAGFLFFVSVAYDDFMGVDSESYSGSEFDPFNNSIFGNDRRKNAKLIIEANHNRTRYIYFTNNKTLLKVPSVFCLPEQVMDKNEPWTNITGPPDFDDCQWKMYGESIMFIPGIAAVVAVLIWPIGQALVTCIRGCACGMCRPRKGCCCCGESADDFSATEDGYSDCSRALTFVMAIVVCLVIFVGMIVGLSGHVEIDNSLTDLVDYVIGMVNTFVDVLNSTAVVINQTATDFNEYVDTDLVNLSQNALNWTNNLYEGIDTARDYLNKADTPREIVMYVTLIAPLVCATLVLISCALCSACSCFMISFGFIFTFLALGVFAINYPISYALSDGCVYLENAMNKSSPEYLDTVAVLFNCDEDSYITNFSESVRDKIDSISAGVCTVVDKLSHIKTLPCDLNDNTEITPTERCPMFDTPSDTMDCNVNNMEEFLNYTFFTYRVGCYIPTVIPMTYQRVGECGDPRIHDSLSSASCEALYPGMNAVSMYCGRYNDTIMIRNEEAVKAIPDDNIRGNATLLMRITNAELRLLDVYREKIRPFIKCETISEILFYAKDFACVSLILGTTPIYYGEMIIAIGSLVGTIVAMLAIKRFNKKYLISKAKKIAEKEMVNLVE